MLRQYAFEGPKLATAIVKTFSIRSTGWINSEWVDGVRRNTHLYEATRKKGGVKMKMQIAILILCLVSCSPRGRIVADQSRLSFEDPDSALVTVMRGPKLIAGGITVPIYLDAEPIARLGVGVYVEFQVRPGEHYLGIHYGDILDVIRFNAKAKGKYYFHFIFDHMSDKGPVILKRLTPEDAKKELSTNRYELLTIGQ